MFRAVIKASKYNAQVRNNQAALRHFATAASPSSTTPKAKQVKQVGFIKQVVGDFGNVPIIAANSAAAMFVIIFGGRKLFFHPDISVSEANRLSNDVQNEGPTRMDDASNFRGQTRLFGSILRMPSQIVMKLATGTDQNEKFHLDFLRTNEIPLPLESTNYFQDGLFEEQNPKPFALNESNESEFHYQYKHTH